jgi:hypothetical protein
MPGQERPRLLPRISLAILLLLAYGVRLLDLTNPPFDYHPTRQLRSAMIARGMYYENLESAPDWQRQMAVRQWRGQEVLEPTILETMVAASYRLAGGEILWIARVFSSLFWVMGALALYLLAKEIASPDGALAGAAYFLFLPLAVSASRAFLPDPLMIALTAWGLCLLYRWSSRPDPSWRMTVVTGLIAGLAPLVKAFALIPLAFGLAGMLLAGGDLRQVLRRAKVWVLGLLIIAPAAVYYVNGMVISGVIAGQGWRFFPQLLSQVRFYLDWQETAVRLMGYGAIIAALLGTLALRGRSLGLVLGLSAGYLVYGLAFPYHITTHDYYQLPLCTILAIGVAVAAGLVMERLAAVTRARWWRVVVVLAMALALVMPLRVARGLAVQNDYRPEVGYWQYLGNLLEHRSNVIMLSHDYGERLQYYGWVWGTAWLGGTGESSEEWIRAQLGGADLFVVTLLGELENQTVLRSFLYDHHAIYAQGEDFVVFDLRQELNTPP